MNSEEKANTMFPILNAVPARGLGRMAAQSEHLDAGHDVEFRSLNTRSILNKSVSRRMQWKAWSINPYRGCEFGCRYCYARYTHGFLAPASNPAQPLPPEPAADPCPSSLGGATAGADGEIRAKGSSTETDLRSPEAFERLIFVKSNAAWLLQQDLRRMARQGQGNEEIALGTATDPWQPVERRARVTRSLLEVLASRDGLRIGVVTKSTLIERDIDLLQAIALRSRLVIHITITTADVELARTLEPRAPRPDLRFATVKRLRSAGLCAGILNSPLLPGITDSAEAIDTMAARARQADASFFAASPLFLKPCSRPTYFDFVREHFPHLQVLYAERFGTMDFAAPPYRQHLRALVAASCRRYGLRERSMDNLLTREIADPKKQVSSAWSPDGQGRLFA